MQRSPLALFKGGPQVSSSAWRSLRRVSEHLRLSVNSPSVQALCRLAFKKSPVPPDALNVDRPVPSPAPPRGAHGRAGSRAAGTFRRRTFSVAQSQRSDCSSLRFPTCQNLFLASCSSGPRRHEFQTTEGLDGFPEVRSEGHRLVWTAVLPSGRSRRVCSAPASRDVVVGRVSVEQEEIQASPRGGSAGTGPREQGPRAGAAPGGIASLSGQNCVQRLDRPPETRYPGSGCGKPLSRWPLAAGHREKG